MKLICDDNRMVIVAENAQDRAYLKVLGFADPELVPDKPWPKPKTADAHGFTITCQAGGHSHAINKRQIEITKKKPTEFQEETMFDHSIKAKDIVCFTSGPLNGQARHYRIQGARILHREVSTDPDLQCLIYEEHLYEYDDSFKFEDGSHVVIVKYKGKK